MKTLIVLFSFVLGAQSFATEYRAKPVTVKGEISAMSNSSSQILEAQVPVYRVDTYYQPVQTTCNRMDCDQTSGDGSTGNWHNFFNAPAREKPKAMADAIKGIGERTAVLIIDAGFFTNKPRSWRAFADEITRAQRKLAGQGYQGQFADLVLQQYGNENARNLGYYVENSCHVVTYPCTVLSEIERETFVYNLERRIEVATRGALLQDFERDRYSIRVGFEPQAVEVTPANEFNTYSVRMQQVSQRDSKVELVATKRNMIAFPEEAGSGSLSVGQGGLVFSGSIQARYLPAGDDAGSRVTLLYKVCKTNLFGGCGKTQIDWTQQPVTDTSFTVQIPGSALRKGDKHKVWYKFVRTGSKYYSGEGYEQKTDAVRFSK